MRLKIVGGRRRSRVRHRLGLPRVQGWPLLEIKGTRRVAKRKRQAAHARESWLPGRSWGWGGSRGGGSGGRRAV